MKVAYNGCFGGFGLSPKALTEFAKKKGIALTWYDQTGYRHEGKEEYTRIDGIPTDNRIMNTALTKDLGEVINSIPHDEGVYYYPDFHTNESRTDKDLIDVIESLGEEANGSCASLCIDEIPDGAQFEITEYDGSESVEPPRMSW